MQPAKTGQGQISKMQIKCKLTQFKCRCRPSPIVNDQRPIQSIFLGTQLSHQWSLSQFTCNLHLLSTSCCSRSNHHTTSDHPFVTHKANWYYVARWEKSGKIEKSGRPPTFFPSPVQPLLALIFDISIFSYQKLNV